MKKEIYIVDFEPFRKVEEKLVNIAGNLNQIVKQANQAGVIHRADIQRIRAQIEEISRNVLRVHSLLMKRTRENN